MKKIKNGTWLPWQPQKMPKKQTKLCLCQSKYLKKGKWHKTEFFISFLNGMKLWFKGSRFFIRCVEIHNVSFELNRRITLKIQTNYKKSSTEIMDLITIKNSWKFHLKSLNCFSDILAGASKSSILVKLKVKWKTP